VSDITVTSPDSLAVEVTVEASTGVTVSVPTVSSISVTEKGPKGDTGETGPQGPAGIGPAGGTENQFVQKNSATDYDTKWSAYTLPAADGTERQVLMTDGAGTVSFAYPQTIAENVKNVSGGPLLKGTPVHVTGSVGNLAEVIAADAATNYPAHFVLDEDLADEGEGKGIALGFINNVDVPDASIYTEGQTVYLGASGGWTTTKPTGTNAIQNLGIIIKVNTGGNKISGVIMGAGRANDVPNIPDGQAWIGNASGVATPTTLADVATSGAYSDLSGTPSIPVSGVDFDPVGTDNSTDVTLGGAYDYITIAGQTITRNQVDYNTDIANTPSIPTSGVDFDPVGTDNSTDVTLAGAYNYLTLLGQQITLGQVDYTTDVSNTPTIPVSGVDFDPVGTDNSTDVTLAGAYNYLTLAGQQITLGQVDYTTDISNTPTIPTSGVDFDPVGTDNSTDVSVNANATDVLRMNAGQILGSQDAGADKLVFWDDSEGKLTYATIGTNLTMTADTLSASGGGSGTITALNNQAENRLTTIGATTTELDGEANLTFDGTTLTVSGEVKADQVYVNAKFPVSPSNGHFTEGARIGRGFFTSGSITAGALYILGASSWTLADADAASTGSGLLVVATDAGSAAEVVLEGAVKLGSNTGFSGASRGDLLYLSTTGGEVTTTAPSATGDIVRVVGYVIDATNAQIYFNPDNTWLEI